MRLREFTGEGGGVVRHVELKSLVREAELREEQRKGAELKQGLERLTGSKRKQRVTRSSAKELEGELEKEPERRTALKNLELSEGQLKQQLRDDWEKQLQELKLKVAHGVMEIVLHEREAHTSDAAGRSVAGDDILTPRGVTAQLAE